MVIFFGWYCIHRDDDEFFRWSCSYGQLQVAEWLHSLGNVDIHAQNDFAFRSSCARGCLETSKWLYSLGGIDIHDIKVLKAAFNYGHEDVTEWFLSLK